MMQNVRALLTAVMVTGMVTTVMVSPLRVHAADGVAGVLEELNATRSVVGTEDSTSYSGVFDAYLELTEPPFPIDEAFNNTTIWPGMPDWTAVSDWAENNPNMAAAIIAAEGKTLFGLPYGRDAVDAKYRDADLIADIGADGSLRNNQFPYLDAIETIAAFGTAEAYRRLEAGRMQDGLDVAVATIFLMRQCCDREFLDEQLYAIALLIEELENLRDIFYRYRDKIEAQQFSDISINKLPHLRPDRQRLLLPEGDKVVSNALIQEVFDARGQADREKFASIFAAIQSEDTPLTRFGAAQRWRMIAEVHDSKSSSLERLELVYNDWYRRWRIEEYDQILDITTQFDRTNPVRFAAVIYSMQNVEKLFAVRNELVAAVHGTAMAGGLCGYKSHYGTYPSDTEKMYAQFVRKRSDKDPFDLQFASFKYRVLTKRQAVDTRSGRIFVDAGMGLLYSIGLDHSDDRASEHTDDGSASDLLFWPPVKAIHREEGTID